MLSVFRSRIPQILFLNLDSYYKNMDPVEGVQATATIKSSQSQITSQKQIAAKLFIQMSS